MPRMLTSRPPRWSERRATLGCVSVVMIASAAGSQLALSDSTSRGSALGDLLHRKRDADDAGAGGEDGFRRDAQRARRAPDGPGTTSFRPCSPVSALALPLLTRMARMPVAGSRGSASCTGAAWARLMVKQPAAAAGTSLTTSARSFFAGLMPAWRPANRKPWTFTARPRGGLERGPLGQPQHEIEVLDRLARGALEEVVDGGDHHHPAGVEARSRRWRPPPRPGRSRPSGRWTPARACPAPRPAARRGRPRAGASAGAPAAMPGARRAEAVERMPRLMGSRCGVKVRRTGFPRSARQRLGDLRGVLVPEHLVGPDVVGDLAEAVGLGGLAPAPETPDDASMTMDSSARRPARSSGTSASAAAVG